MKKKGTIKKGIAWLLTAVMVFSITPVMAEPIQAQAEESQEVTTPTTTKTIAGLGTSVIADPIAPASARDAWKGSYVYYGNYNAYPVKYRVLDASTTDYSADETTQTMLLDCDSILYYTPFDGEAPSGNVWKYSPIYTSLNGDGFLNKDGVFTTAEKNAIAKSTVASHALTTDSETGVKVASKTQSYFVNYVALTGEQIFLLDAEDVSNGAYGYSITNEATENRKKTGGAKVCWWLRSAGGNSGGAYDAGYVENGGIYEINVGHNVPGVSPALNLNLSSVLFSSVISGTAGETGAEYKLTLLDSDMTIAANGDATRNGKTVTIPYSISGTNSANATQVSVLILDKEYTAGNTNGATVLDYQKLNVDSFSASGTGTYTLPDSLYRKGCGTDYHMYILAEDVNGEIETDYASEPVKVEKIDLDISDAMVVQSNTLTYDGTAQTPTFTVTLDNTTLTGDDYDVTVTAQTNAGSYTATITGKGNCTGTISNVTWSISKGTPTADMFTYVESAVYDGTEKSANVVENQGIIGMGEITVKYYQNDIEVTPVNVGEYTVMIDVAEGDSNVAATDIEVGTFTITKATPTADMFTYTEPTDLDFDGNVKSATVETKAGITGMGEITVKYSATPVTAGTYTVSIDVAEGNNYNEVSDLVVGEFTIEKAASVITAAPTPIADLVYEGTAQNLINEGTATGGEMLYSLEEDGEYSTSIPQGLNAGDYKVWYYVQGNENYKDGDKHSLTVTIKKATPIIGTVSASDMEDTLDISKVVLSRTDDTISGTLSLKEGTELKYGTNDYTYVFKSGDANYSDVEGTVSITISDTIAPTATYQIGTNGFNAFMNAITFGFFFKDTQTVEIQYTDDTTDANGNITKGSGIKTKQYYIASSVVADDAVGSISWTDYTKSISLDKNGKYFVYTKVVDNAGNTVILNSDGIVIYEDSVVTTDSADYTYKSNKDITFEMDAKGNTFATLKDSEGNEVNAEYYTVTDNSKITFKAAYLDTLKVASKPYTYKIYMNPQDVETNKTELSYEISINVLAKELSVTGATAIGRTYEKGNTSVEITEVALSGIADTDDVSVDMTGLNGTLSSANAGDYTEVTLPELKLSGEDKDNYVLTQSSKAVPTLVTISPQATGTAEGVTKKYWYSNAHEDTIELASRLPEDCGEIVSYGIPTVSGNVIYEAEPSVSEGILAYTVAESTEEAVGNTGTITVNVQTQNYAKVPIIITVEITDEISVNPQTAVELKDGSQKLTYGQKLSTLELTEVVFKGTDGETVTGTLQWKNSDSVPTIDTKKATWEFVPSASYNDKYATAEGELTINVVPATPVVDTLPTVNALTYHPATTLADIALSGGKMNGIAGELTGTWAWKDTTICPKAGDNTYVAVFTPQDDTNYKTKEVDITVSVAKATPYIKTVVAADAITYGATLKGSTLSGGVVQYSETDETAVAGTWSWKETTTKPVVADSNMTQYDVVFTPTDAENYNKVETKITLTVNKSETTPNMPESTMSALYSKKTVGAVELPEGWGWSEVDRAKELAVDKVLEATAIYNGADKGNYVTESVKISITRQACTHAGKTEVRDAKEATCGEEGYTGDTYCKDCEQKLANGEVIEREAHTYGDPTFSWSEDGKTCTITFVYEEDGTHTASYEATVTSEVKTEATCKDKGTTTYTATYTDTEKKYSEDGKTYTDTKDVEDIPADETKHVESDIVYTGDEDKAPTCTEAGIGHTECMKCQKPMQTNVSVEATGHTGGTATCKNKAECTVCHEAYGELDKNNHTGETEVKDTREATCGAEGYTGDTYCKDCGEIVEAGTVIPKTETHTGGTATCKDKAECTVCHESYGELNQDNHTGEMEVRDTREATCGAEGYTGDTYCKDCGTKIATGTKTDKAGVHAWDAGKVTKAPTATAEGEKTYTCGVCGETKVDKIPATGNTDTGNTDTGNADTGNTDTGNTDTGNTDTGNVGTGNTDDKNTNTDTKLPAVGEKITSEDGSATYQVTEAGENGNAVTYEAPTDKETTTVVIPETVTINNNTYKVTAISDTAFAGNKKITSVTIGDNVTEFSAKTFKGCTNLKTVDVGNGVTSIPANAFKNFKNLTTVKMGTGVKTVGKNAFYGCKKLKTVTVGKSVAKIGAKSFYGCSKLKTLTIKSTKLTAKKIGSKAFTKTPKNMTVKVPKKKFKAYKSMLIKCGVNKNAKFKKN